MYGLSMLNALLQTQKLKQIPIYYLTVSVGQDSGHGLAVSSAQGPEQGSGRTLDFHEAD